MYKLKDIITSGGGNAKINKFINRYIISKKEKKEIIKSIKYNNNNNNGNSLIEDDCWYIMECHDYGNGYEIMDYFSSGNILDVLYCDQLQCISRNHNNEEVIADIWRVGPPSYGCIDSIGALIIPKKVNGYDGFKQLLKHVYRFADDNGDEMQLGIISGLLADNYSIEDFIKFLNEEIIETNTRYVIVTKSECYRICSYIDDENMK